MFNAIIDVDDIQIPKFVYSRRMEIKGQNMLNQIFEGFDKYASETQSHGANQRGRHENIIDTSGEALAKLNEEYKTGLGLKSKGSQRTDAKFASIIRYVKKFPSKLLEYSGSKCKYKSKEISAVVEQYLKAFTKCFVQLYASNV